MDKNTYILVCRGPPKIDVAAVIAPEDKGVGGVKKCELQVSRSSNS